MKEFLFKTNNSLAPTLMRVALGVIILVHGVTKLGSGFTPFEQFITAYLQLPMVVAYATVFIETAGAIMLIAGVATRQTPWSC